MLFANQKDSEISPSHTHIVYSVTVRLCIINNINPVDRAAVMLIQTGCREYVCEFIPALWMFLLILKCLCVHASSYWIQTIGQHCCIQISCQAWAELKMIFSFPMLISTIDYCTLMTRSTEMPNKCSETVSPLTHQWFVQYTKLVCSGFI